MTKNEIANPKVQSPARIFREMVTTCGKSLLTEWVGEERAAEATGRIAAAISASAASARNPDDFRNCTPQSIGMVVAISALTGIMPSTGASALAYAIPRRPRKGEKPQLQYQLSHRGLNALARRSGQQMVAIPIGMDDKIEVTDEGETVILERDFDTPPETMDSLRGIMLVVKSLEGQALTKQFVAKSTILKRRSQSDSYSYAVKNEYAQSTDPWHKWPIEMAMKSAMHYAVSRGWCVLDDTEAVRALSVDTQGDLKTVQTQVTPATTTAADLEKLLEPETQLSEPDDTVDGEVAEEPEEKPKRAKKKVTRKTKAKVEPASAPEADSLSAYQALEDALDFATTDQMIGDVVTKIQDDPVINDQQRSELLSIAGDLRAELT